MGKNLSGVGKRSVTVVDEDGFPKREAKNETKVILLASGDGISPGKHLVETQTFIPNTRGWGRSRRPNVRKHKDQEVAGNQKYTGIIWEQFLF